MAGSEGVQAQARARQQQRLDIVDERRDIATVLKGASAAEVPVSLMKRVR